jgi:hypothetical protein
MIMKMMPRKTVTLQKTTRRFMGSSVPRSMRLMNKVVKGSEEARTMAVDTSVK